MPYALQMGSYATAAEASELKDVIIHNLLRFPPEVLNATVEDITPVPPPTPVSSWTQLASSTVTDSYSSTSAGSMTTINVGSSAWTKSKFIWVHIRDNAGPRSGYFYGSDCICINLNAANGSTTTQNFTRIALSVDGSGLYTQYIGAGTGTTCYGIYALDISTAGAIRMRHRYNATNSRTINGTYTIKVYALEPETGDVVLA